MLLLSVELESSSTASPRGVVLVVEDEVVVRNIVCVVLQREGHKVLAASDGLEALEVAKNFAGRIDLMISDVQMPKLDGLSLVDRIRSSRPDLKFLLISGKMTTALPEDKRDIPFLQKPFRSKELVEKVREVVGNRGNA